MNRPGVIIGIFAVPLIFQIFMINLNLKKIKEQLEAIKDALKGEKT